MQIKNIFKVEESDSDFNFCVYSDTDSVYYPLEPILNHFYGDINNYSDEEIISKSKLIINDVQTFINNSYNVYAKNVHNVSTHGWNIKQELIAKRGFWSGKLDKSGDLSGNKKRYAQWIVDEKGVRKDYIDIKGLEIVRSNYPKVFRTFMYEIVYNMLHDLDEASLVNMIVSFRKNLLNVPFTDIMIPTGVNDIESYSTDELGKYQLKAPIHVKAAINYNQLLRKYNLSGQEINSGDKILWCYLRENPLKFDSFAINVEESIPKINQFVETYIDRVRIFDNLLLNKLQNFWDSVKWGRIILNSNIGKFF